jgi:uncharacterized coiled-coil DUF342 family protein
MEAKSKLQLVDNQIDMARLIYANAHTRQAANELDMIRASNYTWFNENTTLSNALLMSRTEIDKYHKQLINLYNTVVKLHKLTKPTALMLNSISKQIDVLIADLKQAEKTADSLAKDIAEKYADTLKAANPRHASTLS